jgi:hypothetical protein
MTQILEIGKDNAEASQFLEPYVQSGNLNFLIGSGASAPAIKTAGNIEAEINKLIADGEEAKADAKCFDFITEINAVHAKILADKDATVRLVASGYCKLISSIDRILFARKNILLPRQANIFTTNYDLFIEHAASTTPGVILNDGFDRTPSLQPEPAFAPERYFDRTYRSGGGYGQLTEIPTINLIKLHGSLSWRKRPDAVAFAAIPVKALTAAEVGNPSKIKAFLEQHFLILPNLKKFQSTLMERVYYDLLRLYSKAMDHQNVTLLSFGFSFEDEHILDITKRALRNPTAQLIVTSYDQASAAKYEKKFAQQRNVTVICPDATSVIDIERLDSILTRVLSGQDNVTA